MRIRIGAACRRLEALCRARDSIALLAYSAAPIPLAVASIAKPGSPFDPVNAR
jgi:hypothetical protein